MSAKNAAPSSSLPDPAKEPLSAAGNQWRLREATNNANINGAIFFEGDQFPEVSALAGQGEGRKHLLRTLNQRTCG